jgi:spore maturation protein CgeB
MDHPKEREAIAKAGQEITLPDHTFTQRVKQVDAIIKANTFKL